MVEKKRTLLGIFAHPDDESFGPGATLARYAAEGVDVHVIIATDGIEGSVEKSIDLPAHETLAQVRSGELSRAAVALGVASIWSLPYRDSGMRGSPGNDHPASLIQQPLPTLVEEVLGYVDRLQPQVILTHDPFGGYGHPDHVRVCEATTAAFHIAAARGTNGDQAGPQKLYYTAFDKRILKWITRLMPLLGHDPTAIGRNRDINLVEIATWYTPVNTKIHVEDYLARKERASLAHASQYSGGPSYVRYLPQLLRQRMLANDAYTRAFPAPKGGIETDLFADII
ncbi:MAG: PIG-L family deacetylase [Litorilinea sp.]